MNNFINFFLLIIAIIFFQTKSNAQHADCTEAFKVCDYGTYKFNNLSGPGLLLERRAMNNAFVETNSKWISWSIQEQGKFNFMIFPNDYDDDLDLVLYRSEFDCEGKVIIREAMSGPSMSDISNEGWKGDIVLSNKADDEYESKGIDNKKDNLLRTVIANNNDQFFLLVNNFNASSGFTFYLEGTASLNSLEPCDGFSGFNDISIVPNPVLNELIIQNLKSNKSKDVEYELFNSNGKFLRKGSLHLKGFGSVSLLVSELDSGVYYLKIINNHSSGVLKFIKL